MERQAGLGRSLEDVLVSLTPAEPEPLTSAARALFEPETVDARLDSLIADVEALRRRVRRLERQAKGQTARDHKAKGHKAKKRKK